MKQIPITSFSALPPISGDTSVYSSVKTEKTIGGHVDEIDDTLGFERRRRLHPNGTNEEWSNNGRTLTVYGDNFKAVIGDDTITVTGNVNITVNGSCNTIVNGDYNLNVLGNMNVAVKGNIVQKCDGTHVVETGADIAQHSGGNMNVICQGDNISRINGDYDSNIKGKYDVTTFGDSEIMINGKSSMITTGDKNDVVLGDSVSFTGGSVKIVGSDGFSLDTNILKLKSIIATTEVEAAGIKLTTHTHPQNDGSHFGGGVNTSAPN